LLLLLPGLLNCLSSLIAFLKKKKNKLVTMLKKMIFPLEKALMDPYFHVDGARIEWENSIYTICSLSTLPQQLLCM
jgi:hypothetical protein